MTQYTGAWDIWALPCHRIKTFSWVITPNKSEVIYMHYLKARGQRGPIIFHGHPSIFKVIEELPYCCFAGHPSIWVLPDDDSYWNSRMASKCYTLLLGAWKRFFDILGHPSNFKVTRAEKKIFGCDLGTSNRPVAAIKSFRIALFLTKFGYTLANQPSTQCSTN